MVSVVVSFVLSFFPRDVLDEILNLIESVSEDFPSYSSRTGRFKAQSLTQTSKEKMIKHFLLNNKILVDKPS